MLKVSKDILFPINNQIKLKDNIRLNFIINNMKTKAPGNHFPSGQAANQHQTTYKDITLTQTKNTKHKHN